MGLSKMTDNLEELERRMRALESLDATVGNTKGDQPHPNFDGSYNSLFWIQHSGSTKARIPPRPIASIAMSYKGEDLLRKGLGKYFSNLEKKSNFTAEDALKPWLKGFYEYSVSMFGDTTVLKSNAQFTIDKKGGRNTPLIETGALKDAWGVLINGERVEL